MFRRLALALTALGLAFALGAPTASGATLACSYNPNNPTLSSLDVVVGSGTSTGTTCGTVNMNLKWSRTGPDQVLDHVSWTGADGDWVTVSCDWSGSRTIYVEVYGAFGIQYSDYLPINCANP